MPLAFAALLGLAGLVFVLYPLFNQERAVDDGLAIPAAELADGERLARAALREVEFDHALGNLDDHDYAALRTRYERRALAALGLRYQRERELDARIERELAELRERADAPSGRPITPETASSGLGTPPQRRTSPQGPLARRRKGRAS
jgi:hypothetical protein